MDLSFHKYLLYTFHVSDITLGSIGDTCRGHKQSKRQSQLTYRFVSSKLGSPLGAVNQLLSPSSLVILPHLHFLSLCSALPPKSSHSQLQQSYFVEISNEWESPTSHPTCMRLPNLTQLYINAIILLQAPYFRERNRV